MSPVVSPLKDEDPTFVQLSVNIFFCSFKKKIFSEIQVIYFRTITDYICVHHYHISCCIFHHFMFSPCILVWPIIMINYFVWGILLSDLTVIIIFFISFICYYCHLFNEEKHPSNYPSLSRISHRYYSSNIHFHPKEQYCGVCYERTRPLGFQNNLINFPL